MESLTLEEQLKQAERNTQEDPQAAIDMNNAPHWLKEAIERWEREGS